MDQMQYDTDYFNEFNISEYYFNEMHDGFMENINPRSITYALFLDIWTLITNIIVVYVNVTGRKKKVSGYDAQLVNLCATNLIIAAFVIPLTIHHMTGSWNFGEFMCKIYVAADVIVPFTSIIIIIMLTIDRMVAFSHPNLYDWMFETSCCKCIIILPWLTSLLIVVPFWTAATMPHEEQSAVCLVIINEEAAIACPIITFFIPFAILVVLIVSLFVQQRKYITHTHLMTKVNEDPHSDVAEEHGTGIIGTRVVDMETNGQENMNCVTTTHRSIVTLCLLSFVFCLLWLPYQLLSIMMSFCHMTSCVPSPEMIQLVTWLGTSTAGIIPMIILVDRHTRDKLCRCCCVSLSGHEVDIEASQSEVTYL
ncbi:5-hydroxytryptamine receptor 1D [Mactra antiquata]